MGESFTTDYSEIDRLEEKAATITGTDASTVLSLAAAEGFLSKGAIVVNAHGHPPPQTDLEGCICLSQQIESKWSDMANEFTERSIGLAWSNRRCLHKCRHSRLEVGYR